MLHNRGILNKAGNAAGGGAQGNTVCLFHLDGDLTDAVGFRDGVTVGGVVYAAGKFGNGMKAIVGSSIYATGMYVDNSDGEILPEDGSRSTTIEWWSAWQTSSYRVVVSNPNPAFEFDYLYRVSGGYYAVVPILRNYLNESLTGGTFNVPYSTLQHFAIVIDVELGETRLYINGVLQTTSYASQVLTSGKFSRIWFGNNSTLIDEIRISRIARYNADFSASLQTAPFEVD